MPETSSIDSSVVIAPVTTLAPLPMLRRFVLESGGNTSLLIVALSGTMPPDDRDRLAARHLSKNALRQWRLDDRDAAIRELVEHYAAASGRALAGALNRDLVRYAASGYRRSAPPADAKRALLHRVLDLGGGKVPSAAQIRGILAGVRS